MTSILLKVDSKGRLDIPKSLWNHILKIKGSKAKSKSGQSKVVKNQILGAFEQIASEGQGRIPNNGPKKNYSRCKKK